MKLVSANSSGNKFAAAYSIRRDKTRQKFVCPVVSASCLLGRVAYRSSRADSERKRNGQKVLLDASSKRTRDAPVLCMSFLTRVLLHPCVHVYIYTLGCRVLQYINGELGPNQPDHSLSHRLSVKTRHYLEIFNVVHFYDEMPLMDCLQHQLGLVACSVIRYY